MQTCFPQLFRLKRWYFSVKMKLREESGIQHWTLIHATKNVGTLLVYMSKVNESWAKHLKSQNHSYISLPVFKFFSWILWLLDSMLKLVKKKPAFQTKQQQILQFFWNNRKETKAKTKEKCIIKKAKRVCSQSETVCFSMDFYHVCMCQTITVDKRCKKPLCVHYPIHTCFLKMRQSAHTVYIYVFI